MPDQIIDAVMAQSIQADATRTHPALAWITMRDQHRYSNEVIARLVTDAPTSYVLVAETLAGLHANY